MGLARDGGSVAVIDKEERVRRVAAREPESRLWKKIQAEDFVVSVEIDPPKGVTINRVVEQVGRYGVRKSGLD